jgi:hypothetical protein
MTAGKKNSLQFENDIKCDILTDETEFATKKLVMQEVSLKSKNKN